MAENANKSSSANEQPEKLTHSCAYTVVFFNNAYSDWMNSKRRFFQCNLDDLQYHPLPPFSVFRSTKTLQSSHKMEDTDIDIVSIRAYISNMCNKYNCSPLCL